MPVDLINATVPLLVRTGESQPVKIGITPAPDQWAARLGVRGAIVGEVEANSPAARAGLQPVRGSMRNPSFDLIVAIDGEKVTQVSDLAERLAEHKQGDTIEVEIVRDGRKRLKLPVKL